MINNEDDVKKILSRMIEVMEVKGLPQLAEKIGTSRPNIDNWVKRGSIPELSILKAAQVSGASEEWIKTGFGPKKNQVLEINPMIDSLTKNIAILRNVIKKDDEFNERVRGIFVNLENKINQEIGEAIVCDLLKIKDDTPFFKRIIALAWFNNIGATVMLHSIFANAKKMDEQSAKESFLAYSEIGKFTMPQTSETRMMLKTLISALDDGICEFIYENQESFSYSLQTISQSVNSAITSNEKFDTTLEKIVTFFNRKID